MSNRQRLCGSWNCVMRARAECSFNCKSSNAMDAKENGKDAKSPLKTRNSSLHVLFDFLGVLAFPSASLASLLLDGV